MCSINNHIILAESADSQVTLCQHCHNLSLVFKCFCTSFTHPELRLFISLLDNLDERDFHYQFLKENQAILRNSGSPVGLCLSKGDAVSLRHLLKEADLLFEAHQILNSNLK